MRWLCLALLLTGCNSTPARRTLTVFAAASLTEAFGELERAFERAHPDVDVVLSTAGSQILRLQVEQGAPADIFASADARHVDALQRGAHVHSRAVFAHNALTVVVPPDSTLRALRDLPRARRVVLGAAEVPAGRYADALIAKAERHFGGFELRVASREPNVRLALARVEMGEADAALVYRTDARGRRVRELPIDATLNVRAEYHAAVLSHAPQPALARQWMAFLRSPAAQAALERRGFGTE
jgi:molybdate transport system substrate-binding protein